MVTFKLEANFTANYLLAQDLKIWNYWNYFSEKASLASAYPEKSGGEFWN